MSKLRKAALVVAAAAAVAAPVATIAATTGSAEAATTRATVGYVVDGDTIRLTNGQYVRLIGYDADETGSGCKANAQTAAVKRLVPDGATVRLVRPKGEPNKDVHGRLLRYVRTASGTDVGTRLIRSYGAHARYDSTDGYAHHPLQALYHRLDADFGFTCQGGGNGGGNGGGTQPPPAQPTPSSGDLNSYPPVSTYNCPPNAPIKGNASSMIYHMPGQQYYNVTTPEECFASEAGAQAHGYRAAKI